MNSIEVEIEEFDDPDPNVRRPPILRTLRFSQAEMESAADTWGFNCGPASLCALLPLTPEEVRPHLEPFKGYMNPTAMRAALQSLRVEYTSQDWSGGEGLAFPKAGLALIQWGGPWMRPRVPIPARYKHTHWVASYRWRGITFIYDVNGIHGWMSKEDWETELVPWLLEQVKRSDGKWWVSRSFEVVRRG